MRKHPFDATHAREPSPGTRLLVFLLAGGMGAFICGLYFGVIPWRPSRHCRAVFCDPYHWQVLGFGLTFLLAGLAFVIPRNWRWLGRACSLGFIVSLVSSLVGTFAAR